VHHVSLIPHWLTPSVSNIEWSVMFQGSRVCTLMQKLHMWPLFASCNSNTYTPYLWGFLVRKTQKYIQIKNTYSFVNYEWIIHCLYFSKTSARLESWRLISEQMGLWLGYRKWLDIVEGLAPFWTERRDVKNTALNKGWLWYTWTAWRLIREPLWTRGLKQGAVGTFGE
jgi:hypothetical protein